MSARIFDFLDEDRFPLSGKWKAEGTPRAFPLLMPGPVRTVPRSAQAFGARPGQPIGAAILVHQFGVVLGTTRRPVEAAQGDVELAPWRRALKTASAGRLPPSPPVPAPSNSPDGTGGAGGSFVP